jgi:hypothetical protein
MKTYRETTPIEPDALGVVLVRDELRSGGFGPAHVGIFIYRDGQPPLFIRLRSYHDVMFLVQHLLENGGAAWPAAMAAEA